MITCPRCGVDNTTDSNFCRRCGAHLSLPDESAETTAGVCRQPDRVDSGAASDSDYDSIRGTVLQIRSGGDREGEIIPVDGDVLTIGRSPQSDLFLDDVTVSRHHARILIEPQTATSSKI